MVGKLEKPDAIERVGDALFPLGEPKADQPRGVAQVVGGGELVVKADRIGQIADAALDRKRLARRIEPEHAHLAVRNVGQPEQHQDGRRLARTIGTEKTENLPAPDGKRNVVDGDRLPVVLGEAFGLNDDIPAHRRPNLATAPTMTRSATPMMPTPAIPHIVDVVTVTRKSVEAELAAGSRGYRRHIVAGDRLVGRRDLRLHFLVRVGRNALDRVRIKGDLPPARRRAAEFDILGRRRAGVGDDDRNSSLLTGRSTRGNQTLAAAHVELRLAGDGEAEVGRRRRILCAHARHELVVSGCGGIRRRHLKLHVLALAGIDRHGVELLGAILLGKRNVEVARRLRGQAHRELLAAVVLDAERVLESSTSRYRAIREAAASPTAWPADPWPA